MTQQEAIQFLKETIAGCHILRDRQLKAVCEVSINALEKQIPKKTTKRQYVPKGTLVYGHCPNCDCFTKNFFKYCGNCSQALDWSDTE